MLKKLKRRITIVTPVPAKPSEPELDEEDLIDIGAPIAPIDDETLTNGEPSEENKEDLGAAFIPVGVPTEGEEKLTDIDEPLNNPEENKDKTDVLGDTVTGDELTDLGEKPEAPETETENEREKVEEVADAKPSLLSKWDKVVFAAIGFLNAVGVTGVAYHLATLHDKLKITNITQNITVSQDTEKDQDQDKDQDPKL